MNSNRELNVNMLDVVQTIVNRKVPILVFTFLVTAITAIVSLVITPRYISQAVLMPPSSSSESSFGRILRSVPLGKISGVSKLFDGTSSDLTSVYMSILESRSLQMELIRKFDLIHVYKFDRKKSYYIEDVLKKLNKNIAVGRNEDNGTIEVEAIDRDPARAAAMANYMVTQLETIYVRLMTEKNRDYRVYLGQRLDTVKANLRLAEENLVAFQKQHHMMDLEAQGKATLTTGVEMEAKYLSAQTTLEIARKTFSEDHPRVRNLKLQLEQMDKARRNLSNGRVSDFLLPYSESQNLGLEYLRLKREFEIQQTILEFMVPQYEEAKFEESKNTPNVQVLDPAVPAEKRLSPKRRRMVQAAFAISFLTACAGAVMFNAFRNFRDTNPASYAKVAGIARSLWTLRNNS